MEELNAGARRLVFNLGIGRGFSVREVVESVRRVSGVDFAVIEESRREGDPPRLVASSERIKAELGWRPSCTELDEIVSSAWQWHSTHPEGYSG
jgi:UDP-glucose 4-epimerase